MMMEKIELDDVIGFSTAMRLEKALSYENYARTYLILVALKQQGHTYCTSLKLSKLMGINYSYAWQLLTRFEAMELLDKLGQKPKKYRFLEELERPEYIAAAKRTLGMEERK